MAVTNCAFQYGAFQQDAFQVCIPVTAKIVGGGIFIDCEDLEFQLAKLCTPKFGPRERHRYFTILEMQVQSQRNICEPKTMHAALALLQKYRLKIARINEKEDEETFLLLH